MGVGHDLTPSQNPEIIFVHELDITIQNKAKIIAIAEQLFLSHAILFVHFYFSLIAK